MKNRKGFTLVELLAVIAILAILVIIALPNIMDMFNEAKKNSFLTECKQIYDSGQNKWMSDSMFDTNEQTYIRCKTCTGKSLDLSGRTEIDYIIKINKAGKVIKLYVTDGTYQFIYDGNGLLIEDINNAQEIAKLSEDDIINIADYINKLNSIVCKRAKILHTETCNNGGQQSYGVWTKACKSAGYTLDGIKNTTTITYGSLGTPGTLNPGDAFDCDVNNDGIFNSSNERFYYLSLKDGILSGTDAVLIYYNNVSGGVANNKDTFKYSNSTGTGPDVAYNELPSINIWTHPSLHSNFERQIKNRFAETTYSIDHGPTYNLPVFTYTNKAARFATTGEIVRACGNGIAFKTGNANADGYFRNCEYVMENTNYSDASLNKGYWTETWAAAFSSQSNPYSGVHVALGEFRGFGGNSSTNTMGVRPVIEVSLDAIEY